MSNYSSTLDTTLFEGFDHLEFYVGNARQAAYFYRTAFGFEPVAYAGPETGVRDRVSFVLVQNQITLVFTSSITNDGEIAAHFARHDDGLRDIAISVSDAGRAFDKAVAAGATPVMKPTVFEDESGRIVKSTVGVFGDTVHSFIERRNYHGAFAPGYSAMARRRAVSTGLVEIDHLAISVEPGANDKWVDFYAKAFELDHTQRERIASEYSGMKTDVIRNGQVNKNGGREVAFVLVEPVTGQRRSPIDEYLSYYKGAGVHHIGLRSDDIVSTVETLRANGVEFARTPSTYYDVLSDRVGKIEADTNRLREQEILVDRDDWGYLLQIFAKPVQTRPTYFFEIIQRQNARGFGNGNITALFEAIEREQLARGNA